jgi:hypothetical protein
MRWPTVARIEAAEAAISARDSLIAKLQAQVEELQSADNTEVFSGFWDEGTFVPSTIDFPGVIIATLPVPPGRYVVVAKMDVAPHVNTNGHVGCRLVLGASSDEAWSTWQKPQDPSQDPLFAWNPQSIALNVVGTYKFDNQVILQCWSDTFEPNHGQHYDVLVYHIKVTAIKIGALTNNPLNIVE